MAEVVEKKKRGRKRKEDIARENIQISVSTNDSSNNIVQEPPVAKKRGRKPKGGKIIAKEKEEQVVSNNVSNVILHLKCNIADLNELEQKSSNFKYNPDVPSEIESYEKQTIFSSYHENSEVQYAYNNNSNTSNVTCSKCNNNENINSKEINSKLKNLKINLYKNLLHDKKSACFWCTYEFDNPPCYIPKHEIDNNIYGYGSFCRPECAVAYLMKEPIDDSTKFERYSILNNIYSKVYDYEKNIKPAPNPYYLLDKFYGNLSIQEYRHLLNSQHLLLVIDKPMTRILPELYEDNDNFVLNIYNSNNESNSNSMYKVKRQSDKKEGPTKKSIIENKFGLAT